MDKLLPDVAVQIMRSRDGDAAMNEQSEARRRGLLSLYGLWNERDNHQLTLRDLINVVWRRRWVVLATVVVVTGAAILVISQMTPLYSSTAMILVEPRVNRVADSASVLSDLPVNFETVQTETEVLTSRRLQEKVVKELNLTKDPEFNPTLRDKPIVDKIWDGLFGNGKTLSQDQILQVATNVLASAVSVDMSGRSRVITVTVRAQTATKAARIANALSDAYLVSQLDAKFEATQRTVNWLNKRLAELRGQVRESEQAVEQYRQQAGLIEGRDSSTAAADQLTSLNAQIVLAGTQRAEAEARLKNVKSLIDSADGPSSAAEVLDNDLIQKLKEQESTLRRNLASLSQRYGPKHPQILQAKAELADVEQKLKSEVAKIVASLEGDVAVARSREQSLIDAQHRLEAQLGDINKRQIKLRELTREGDANRELLEAFLNRFKELAEQQDLQTTDSRVISEAQPPIGPSSPRTTMILFLALVGSTGLGMALAFLIEQLDSGVHTTREIENWTGLPVLTVVPEVKSKSAASRARQVVSAPLSRYSESYRNLLVSLNLSNVDNPPKIVAVTSANPSEGKTVTSLSLAATAVAADKRVLLIDCDLRRPRVHSELGVERGPGLVDFLAGQASLESVIRTDERLGLQFITAGSETQNVLNLIESQKLRTLLTQLKPHFGLIIIDTPPLLAVADAKVLAERVDSLIFAVRWGKTPRATIIDGLKMIEGSGAAVAGIVMTRADLDRLSSYQYGTSYYGKAYKSYYSS
ncbi:MAG: polysaccharide biosynthesis tyrosine autokinase [Alphaproteobacteria bacterium]|nr:polysaccharide biosynthesis tyrosine autokinase [Alphaproteobacteria bacterium]